MATATLPKPPRQTNNPSPVRAASSVRRTASIDVSWPDGPDKDRLMIGTARDYLTPASGAGRVIAEGRFDARLDMDKVIDAITATPEPANLERLVGQRGGAHLRLALRDLMPELLENGDPLYLVLDDISGTALVSAFAWSQWHDDWGKMIRDRMSDDEFDRIMSQRVNVCWGLQEGNSGVQPGGPPPRTVAEADAGELRNPADPDGWHELPESEGPGFRRARRIDVSRDPASGLLRVNSSFQDSAKRKEGGRVAIHEYDLEVTADPDTLEILTLEPKPHILPFWECPGAVANARDLIGTRIDDIRDEVLAQLRGPRGCTHLNDAMRALAEVPKLASHLS